MARNLVSAADLTISDLEWLWQRLEAADSDSRVLAHTPVSLVFDTPSTRTMLAFCKAAIELGTMPVVIERERSRLASGESVEDTIGTVAKMVGGIIIVRANIRTSLLVEDAAIVNAGDACEHPTQAIVDIFSIARRQSVAALSEIRPFTLTVFAGAGALFRPVVSLVRVLQTLNKGRVSVVCESGIDASKLKNQHVMANCDVLCPEEPFQIDDAEMVYVLESYDTNGHLRESEWLSRMETLYSHATIMHPLPRSKASVAPMAAFHHSLVDTQLALHVPVRRAVLLWMAAGSLQFNLQD